MLEIYSKTSFIPLTLFEDKNQPHSIEDKYPLLHSIGDKNPPLYWRQNQPHSIEDNDQEPHGSPTNLKLTCTFILKFI